MVEIRVKEEMISGMPEGAVFPIVANLAGQQVSGFEYEATTDGTGGNPGRLIATFTYTTPSGLQESRTTFVKKEPAYPFRHGYCEAKYCSWLEKHHAPIPRVFGSYRREDGYSIVFLEYLDEVPPEGEWPNSKLMADEQWLRDYLDALARLNAICLPGEKVAELRRDMGLRPDTTNPWSPDWRSTPATFLLENIWSLSGQGRLGDEIAQLCGSSQQLLGRLVEVVNRIVTVAGGMDDGLVQGDAAPHHAGRRSETGELVLLDLEDLAIAPRFFDTASCLGAPESIQPRCLSREELGEYYLERYAYYGGDPIPVSQLLEQATALWQGCLLPTPGELACAEHGYWLVVGDSGTRSPEQHQRHLCKRLNTLIEWTL